ncbi:TolC family outer membrane protein [uncultured Azonexus sp.]|uniref:TolC family outer membrane protein n=1 Tax=uncultured Azonexus sp. TaxID=520307 RepID=UPI0026393E7F|nr:TolC family outer membrane protein [uncultured Azonexus sp.]
MKIRTIPFLLAVAVFPVSALAQNAPSPEVQQALREIAQQAVLKSPEVTTKWRNYKAADEEIGVARGGYFPRVDLTAGTGRESLKTPPTNVKDDYTRRGYALTLNQMVFDGFATRSEVRKLDKARLVRYYELLEASENVALEASRAYLDVLRYRFLVDLAEDNYIRHKATHEQLKARTASGVGRRVDLEQAGSRLALAEVNLTTETANLHDVSARYQRLVGNMPPDVIVPPSLVGSALPASPKAALDILHKRNPTLHAAIENIEAAQHDIAAKRSAYSPRVDLRARTESTSNYQGVSGDRDYNVAEVVFSWNLFNGGSDRARERQFMERKHMAVEMREKACRDTRQTLLIAYNDVLRLKEQSNYLATQVALLEKTRNAYRDQFNVGQRTLLDLLDTENELLSARRAAVNADTDLTLAYLRTYAGMGSLLEFMGLQKLDTHTPTAGELAEVDAASLCPTDAVTQQASSRDALDAKAREMMTAPRSPVVAQAPQELVPQTAVGDIENRVRSWAEAWSAKDYSAYTGFYAPTFTPDGGLSREDWDQLRRARISPRERISVTVDKLQVRMDGEERAFAEFEQTYRSNIFNDRVMKTLEMIKVDGKWLINRESSTPCVGNTVGGCHRLAR